MKLIIFDVDGTLTDSNEMDENCFLKTIEKQLKLKAPVSKDLLERRGFQSDTDLAMYLWEHYKGRFPRTFEINQLKQGLISAFAEYRIDHSDAANPIEGAKELFEELKNRKDIALCIATGCWRRSAEYKLDEAGIKWRHVPIISADSLISKYDILKEARNHSGVFYGRRNFDLELYIGDRVWDHDAAKKLGMKFIMRSDNSEDPGDTKLNSYPEIDHFLEMLDEL